MSAGQTDLAQLDFSAGVTRDAAPHQIDPRAVWDHVNGLHDEDGSAFKRGGTVALSTNSLGESGRWIWSGTFVPGRRTIAASRDGFYVLKPDKALAPLRGGSISRPPSAAYVSGLLFIGGGWVYAGSYKELTYSTGTVSLAEGSTMVTGTGTSFLTRVDAGMMLQIGNGRLYVVASVESDTRLTLAEPYDDDNFDAEYTAWPLYRITSVDPYEKSDFYATVSNRLAAARGNQVRLSEVEAPHDWTATIVGGEPDQVPTVHEVPEGVSVRGLSVISQTLLIHTSGGTWTLEGLDYNIVDSFGTPQHRLRVLSRDMVIWGQAGIATWQQALIIPCLDGIYLVDGISSPRALSGPIDESIYRDYVRRGYQPGGAAVGEGHYLLPILSATADAVKGMLVCRIDRRIDAAEGTRPWSRFEGRGGRLAALSVDVVGNKSTLLGIEHDTTSCIVDCSGYFAPTDDNMRDVNQTIGWELVTRDFETGNLTANVVRHLRSLYELEGDGATINFDYSFGELEESTYTWDDWNWAGPTPNANSLRWAGPIGEIYYGLNHPAGESNGQEPHRCHVNKRTRKIRFRARNATQCSRLRLRSLELFIRESRAVRR